MKSALQVFGWIFLAVVIAIVIGFATDYINISKVEQPEVTRIIGGEPEPEFCLQGIYPVQSGGSFELSENHAGEFQYQLIATSRGVEVWIPCGKIE